jgi:hypothetical protein
VVRAAAEVLAAGDVLGGRYRLERLVGGDLAAVGTGLWRAEDLTLSRPVAVRTVVDASVSVRTALFDAAARASGAHDPRIAQTYDADEHPSPSRGRGVAYLVREWVDGEPLRRQLTDGGMDPERLQLVLRHAAEAVAALHASGGWHGRVHPDNLIVLPDGRVQLTDAGTAAALVVAGVTERTADGTASSPPALPPAILADLALGPRSMEPPPDASALRRAQRYDTCDLGRVLYAAATGTWIGGGWRGLPAAPTDGERPRSPRQVRAAVPRDLDAVVCRVLLPPPGQLAGLQDAAAVAVALGRIPPVDRETARTERRSRVRRPRPWTLRALLLVAIALLGVLGYSVGHRIGRVPGTADAAPTLAAVPTSSGPAGTTSAVITLKTVTAFDPPPGDGKENDDEIPLAYDGSTSTAWTTEIYSSATFGGLKTGVGLLVDLGTSRHVSTVQLALTGTGTSVQLRAGDADATTLAGYPVVTAAQTVGATVTLTANATHRYWLIWLTRLPKAAGGYRGGIAEMVFRS